MNSVAQSSLIPSLTQVETYLVSHCIVREDQLAIARQHCHAKQASLVRTLTHLGYVDETIIAKVQSIVSGYPLFEESQRSYPLDLLDQVPLEIWKKYKAFPIDALDGHATIALSDVYDFDGISALQYFLGAQTSLSLIVATHSHIEKLHLLHFTQNGRVRKFLSENQSDPSSNLRAATHLVDLLLEEALDDNASDIHFIPEETCVIIRMRTDGVLRQAHTFHKAYWPHLCNRLKVLGNLDISESRTSQDGRFLIEHRGHKVDCRLSVHPILSGESLVIRFLPQGKQGPQLCQLSLPDAQVDLLKELALAPEGLIIIAGPTGSGKTTTLYALLNFLNKPDVNIMTLEDPVEYQLPHIRQTQVSDGFNFAAGVRSILRQDPDILLLGEIRDPETAQMALHAALTGHKILTTVHTMDVPRTIFRLQELGLQREPLCYATLAIISQRLLRKLCPSCKKESKSPLFDNPIFEKVGCKNCNQTGYKGRFPIAEIGVMTPQLREAFLSIGHQHDWASRLADLGASNTLWEQAMSYVKNGHTSLSELKRVLGQKWSEG
jgi:type II secretory ATPase GspE/PulE/Tfp pilus assembly ATPase PilB-like protein